MALTQKIRSVRKNSNSLLSKLGLVPPRHSLGANFRHYGKQLGIVEYADFVALAHQIYRDAQEKPSAFTVIELSRSRKVVDYQCKLRGIYEADGEPVAFFCPELGSSFESPQQELEEFRLGLRAARLN